ncbi:MAG: hypothetical protein PHI02_06980 [Sulfurovaceae bacterium]|nr:hypothetical protein [Sulfurovaceae bacterium]
MMNYYKTNTNDIYAYNEDTNKDFLASKIKELGLVKITEDEAKVILNPPLTAEQLREREIETAQQYLRDTDFYMTVDKYATLDEDRKQELTRLRQEARDTINQLKSNL